MTFCRHVKGKMVRAVSKLHMHMAMLNIIVGYTRGESRKIHTRFVSENLTGEGRLRVMHAISVRLPVLLNANFRLAHIFILEREEAMLYCGTE